MKWYTSYYGNFRNIPQDILCIGISRSFPDYFRTTSIPNFMYTPRNILAPSAELLAGIKGGTVSEEEYKREYLQSLIETLDRKFGSCDSYFQQMEDEFSRPIGGVQFKGVAFLCWEKPGQFCHRHILAALMRHYGYEVEEMDRRMGRPDMPKDDKSGMRSLLI